MAKGNAGKENASTEIQLAGLTAKQKRFCEEYVIDWNGRRAAIAAGYSKKTAGEMAYENLNKPQIKAYIEEVQSNLAKLCEISAAMVVLELKKIAFSSAASIHEDWGTLKNWEDLTEAEKASLAQIEITEKVIKDTSGDSESAILERKVKVKSYDKLAAMRQIAQILGFDAPIKVDQTQKQLPPTREDLEKELEEIKRRRRG